MWNLSLLGSGFKQIKRAFPFAIFLRKSYFSLLLLADPISAKNFISGSVKNSSQNMGYGSVRINLTNGLLLYYHQYSFYSQKVVMALHEKKLPFESHIIDISKDEQYQQWYLDLNPKGEVPVLQDTGKIIPDSSRIIDYLEDNFSNGDTPRLIPMDQGLEVRQKVTYFRNLIDKPNGNVLTVGSFLHPELATGKPKIPFIAPVRRALVNAERSSSQNLRKYAEQNPKVKETLLEKASNQERKHELLLDKNEFVKILNDVEEIFDIIEQELSQHISEKKQWWLCTDRFTVADISFTILLERLNQVGLETRFWTDGKRPHIEDYYRRVKGRDSYKQTIPNTFFFIKTIFIAEAPLIIGVSIAAVIAIIVGGYFVVKKIVYK